MKNGRKNILKRSLGAGTLLYISGLQTSNTSVFKYNDLENSPTCVTN
jgi:hypothetical protein